MGSSAVSTFQKVILQLLLSLIYIFSIREKVLLGLWRTHGTQGLHENTPVPELKRKVSALCTDGGINHSSRHQPAAGSRVKGQRVT